MSPAPGAAARRVVLLDAPTNLGLRPPAPGREPGCHRAPAALRAHDLLATLAARDGGAVPAPPYHPERDDTGVRNGRAVARHGLALADRTAALLAGGEWPLVLGGDCSILLGNLLALRRGGARVGLLYVDGHLDFRHPAISDGVGASAGEALALVTGRGHPELADLGGAGPLVADGDVVALGNNEWDAESIHVKDTAIAVLERAELARRGPAVAARDALATLRKRGVERAWLHLDVDVLDAALMPAVDSPNDGGLRWEELTELLAELLADPLPAGMELTIFDPELDPDGRLAARLVRLLGDVLG